MAVVLAAARARAAGARDPPGVFAESGRLAAAASAFAPAFAVISVVIAAFMLITAVGWGVARQVSSLVDTFPQYEKNLAVKFETLKKDGPGFMEKTQWIMKRISRQMQKIRPPPIEETRGESKNPCR